MKYINQLFLKGLIVILPVILSIYLLYSILTGAEGFFGGLIKGITGDQFYIPGLGILLTILLILFIGFLVSNFLTGKIIDYFTRQFEKIPFVKIIYGPLRDLMSLFSTEDTKDKMQKVVFVKLDGTPFEVIGLVTREEFSDLDSSAISQDKVVVYIPMSYMIGGFSAIVDKSAIRETNIPVEKALKLAITGWVKAKN